MYSCVEIVDVDLSLMVDSQCPRPLRVRTSSPASLCPRVHSLRTALVFALAPSAELKCLPTRPCVPTAWLWVSDPSIEPLPRSGGLPSCFCACLLLPEHWTLALSLLDDVQCSVSTCYDFTLPWLADDLINIVYDHVFKTCNQWKPSRKEKSWSLQTFIEVPIQILFGDFTTSIYCINKSLMNDRV